MAANKCRSHDRESSFITADVIRFREGLCECWEQEVHMASEYHPSDYLPNTKRKMYSYISEM